MEIKYLKKMKDTPKIGQWVNRGISEQEIEKLEKEFNIKFPKLIKSFYIWVEIFKIVLEAGILIMNIWTGHKII